MPEYVYELIEYKASQELLMEKAENVDWATTEIDSGIKSMWYRFSRKG